EAAERAGVVGALRTERCAGGTSMSVTARPKRRRRNRVTVASSAVFSVIALVLTGFALSHPGLTSSEVDVSNGGVWVANQDRGLLGRVNVDAGEIDGKVA